MKPGLQALFETTADSASSMAKRRAGLKDRAGSGVSRSLTDRLRAVPSRWKIGIAAAGIGAVILAAVLLIFKRPDGGTLRIEVEGDGIDVLASTGETVTLQDKTWEGKADAKRHTLAVKVGDQTLKLDSPTKITLPDGRTVTHKLALKLNGTDLSSDSFEIVRGETTVVTISYQKQVRPKQPPTDRKPPVAAPSWSFQEVTRLTGHSNQIAQMVLSPDGKRMLTVSRGDDPSRLWDLTTNKQLPIPVPKSYGLFLPKQKMFFAGRTFQRYDLSTKKPDWDKPAPRRVRSGAIPFGESLGLVNGSPFVYVVDLKTGDVKKEPINIKNTVNGIAVHPNRKEVWVGSKGEIVILNASDWTEKRRIPSFPAWTSGLAFSADGSKLIASSHRSPEVWLFDVATQKVKKFKGHTGFVNSLSFLPGDRQFVSGSAYDKSMRLWDVDTGKQLAVVSAEKQHFNIVIAAPDGHVYSAGGDYYATKKRNSILPSEFAIYKWRIQPPAKNRGTDKK